jgi:hypothetical protein
MRVLRVWFWIASAILGWMTNSILTAQDALRLDLTPGIIIPEEGEELLLGPNEGEAVAADKRKTKLMEVMRGLVQNELDVIDQLCNLSDEQKQALVDLAEREWQIKTSASVSKCTQQQMFGIVDLDALAERVCKSWLLSTAKGEQLALYEQELAARMSYRKRALISKILDTLEVKMRLTSGQMKDIEEILNREWRDRWFRSIEATFTNVSLHPEIRLKWIDMILTDAQQAALAARENQSMFSAYRISADLPRVGLDSRLSVGSVESADSIGLGTKESPSKRRIREALENAPRVEEPVGVPNR